jgi:hypothetical protein
MALHEPLLLCLFVTALFAGCAGSDPQEAAVTADPASEDQPAVQPVQEADQRAAPPIRTAVCSGLVQAAVGVAGNLQVGLYCPFDEAAPGDLSDYEAAVVEVRWPDAGPTQTSFNLFLLSETCNFGSAGGSCFLDFDGHGEPSFRYQVPRGLLRSDGDDGLRVYASFDGPAVQQRVDVGVTLVPAGGALPEGHTAFA